MALAFVVLNATGSPIAVGAVFLVATLPNLLFGPIAGTLVDRWDHREVMIVSDLLRAGVVLLIPIAVVTDLVLVYPLVFLVTTISIFFRPAKGAILPRLIHADDLVAGNSAMWIAETFADIGGYVVAGLFVALLGSQLPLAFWADSVTYVASAILIATISVAPIKRTAREVAERGDGFFAELREGWRFLRGEAVLFANTLQATVGQFMLGIFLALTPVYAQDSIRAGDLDASAAYSFIEGAIGAGNLIGGFAIGLVGTRIALGRMIIVGYAWTGACVAALALTGNIGLAIGLSFGAGRRQPRLRHPEPDARPAPNAAGAHGPPPGPALLARLRLDDGGDGRGRGARRGLRGRAGPRRLRSRHGRGGPCRPALPRGPRRVTAGSPERRRASRAMWRARSRTLPHATAGFGRPDVETHHQQ